MLDPLGIRIWIWFWIQRSIIPSTRLNVVLLVQDTELVIPIDEHDACVVARLDCHLQAECLSVQGGRPLLLLHHFHCAQQTSYCLRSLSIAFSVELIMALSLSTFKPGMEEYWSSLWKAPPPFWDYL